MAKYFLLLFTALSLTFTAAAQKAVSDSTVSPEFKAAVDLFVASDYSGAQKLFEKISSVDPYNPNTTVSYLFDGKCLLNLKEFDKAQSVLKKFISLYPQSEYSDEAKLTLAKVYYDSNDYSSAFNELNNLMISTAAPYYSSYAKSTAQKIAMNDLTAAQLRTISDSTSSIKSKPFLLLVLGKIYLRDGSVRDAESAFSQILKSYPNSEERSEAVTLLQNIDSEKIKYSSTAPLIGVMLPLNASETGHASDAGSEILDGIKFAVAEYNMNHTDKIGLLIRNTERNENRIKEIKQEFSSLSSIKAIIGPIFSDEVREALEAFKDTDIPIISPTATDNDLTGLYPNFYQANPSFEVRGKVMAEYIFYVENKRRMAVFNAVEGYSPQLAGAFINEFQSLGGSIVIHETYKSNSISYQEQVSKIAADSAQLDGIYLPLVDRRDVPALLSQFVQSGLSVPIYGNQDWFLAKGYETSPELSNKLTFTSDYFIDYTNPDYQSFSRKFFNQTNVDVDRNVLYGFDAAEYLLSVMKNINAGRAEVKSELESAEIYRGFHNNYYFDSSRVNKFLNIVRYRDGKFELVDKFKLSR